MSRGGGYKVDKDLILEFFKARPRPLSMRDMAASMGLSSAGFRALKKEVRQMVGRGELVRTKRGYYGPVEEMDLVSGYFEAYRDGFGFVIQEKPGQRDVFIPARATMSAMDGDRVVASVLSRAKRSGRIVRILERAHTRIAGIVEFEYGSCFVRPKGRAVAFDIHIPAGAEMGAAKGQSVMVEIESYPTDKRPAVGKVVKLLEQPENVQDDVKSIIEEFNLPGRFPSRVSAEAREVAARPPGKRRNLKALNTVTIDGETAKDFDDAVSIRRDSGGYTLWVHIADVGHYVGWDTPLDKEARARATSVYFPGTVIPMLPKALSEDVCSLRPGVPRAAFTVEMALDENGNYTGAEFYPSTIVSNERMTYTSMKKIIVDKDATVRQRYSELLEDFEIMAGVARVLRSNRMARGSLDFDLPEPEVLLDVLGNPDDIIRAERNFAHMLIEEFMIAANEAVASFLERIDAPCLYRIHEEPDPAKVVDVMRVAAMPVRKKKSALPESLRALVTKVKGSPMEEAINYMVLRSLKQARYSEINAGHFGLASDCYCHFTSPIRRYPDLVVHRVLREVVTGGGLSDASRKRLDAILPDIAFQSSRRERVSMEAERAVLEAMRVWFMLDKVGQEFSGVITGVTPKGIRVRLDDYFVEGFISLSDLTDDYYIFDEDSLALRGRNTKRSYKFGHPMRVSVDRVDLEERRVIFGIVTQGQ